ncbi:hypothetical protein [Gorillibacterium sp. sgz5001074]|uniref:hypothetical protein n=1 Tax=Gorillibacterium sp. sgz5001074 TaxID=3446695 RepID=UPI003F67B022
MIQSSFKQQVYNDRLKCYEPCQVIVRYENESYHANILSLGGEPGAEQYIQVDTPAFASQSELKAHIREMFGLA